MLGETYEIVEGDTLALCEQVSQHPPITATHFLNKKLGWRFYTNHLAKTQFRPQSVSVDIIMDHLCYVEFDQRPEKFETANPVLSLHNLIGEAYIDIGGTTKTMLVPPGGKGSAPFEI